MRETEQQTDTEERSRPELSLFQVFTVLSNQVLKRRRLSPRKIRYSERNERILGTL